MFHVKHFAQPSSVKDLQNLLKQNKNYWKKNPNIKEEKSKFFSSANPDFSRTYGQFRPPPRSTLARCDSQAAASPSMLASL
jgi:hypothetical protein